MKLFTNIQQIRSNQLVKNSAKLLSANVIAQVIGFLIYPLLTRIYSPTDFGLLNLFLSIGGVLVLFATGAYYGAIVLPQDTSQGAACFHIGMFCNVLVTSICLISTFFSSSIASVFNVPLLSQYYYLLPLYVFLSAMWQLLNYWYVREKQFTVVSAYQVGQSTLGAGLKLSLGIHATCHGGLLYAAVISPLLSLAAVIGCSFRALRPLLKVQYSQCKEMACQYRKFPQFTLPKLLVNYLGGNLPVLLLAPFFHLSYLGYFGMALALSFTPISIITKSFYQVLFSYVTNRVQNNQTILGYYRQCISVAVLLIVVCFGTLYFVLPSIISWLLGSSWVLVAHYIQYLLPWLAVISITNTFDFIMDVFGKQDKQFYFELLLFVLRVIVLVWAIVQQQFIIAVVGFSAVSFLLRLGYGGYQYYLIKQYEKQRCKSI
jgi:O-antigen/teichoic acid export membrane protein